LMREMLRAMTGSPFLAFAERHGLDYAEQVAPGAAGKFPLPHGETTELVGGALPGGCEGLVARLQRQVDESKTPIEFTLVVTRVPESVDLARFIRCFEGGFRGVVSRTIGAGGLGWIREYTFESIEFNRRYRIAMLRTGKEERLRQLFSPTFLDWMADTAPEGLYFDLVSGVLTVTLARGSPEQVVDVERACELAGHIAERIRSEALEGTGLDDGADSEAEAARAAVEARYAGQIERAGFGSPPADVASALKRLGPVVKGEKGFLRRLFGSNDSTKARMVALSAVLHSYADRVGLECSWPDALHELFPFFDHFPLPVMRQLSLRNADAGTSTPGALVAFVDVPSMASREGLSYRPAFEVDTGDADAVFIHVLPRPERDGQAPTAFGGFSVALGPGARRETEPTRREREEAAALAESLGGRFDVVAHRRSGAAPVGEAARAWLASGAGDALVIERGKLTLVGAARPVIEWSFGTLDEFRASVAPVIAEVESASS
jgi:hypothetical protein